MQATENELQAIDRLLDHFLPDERRDASACQIWTQNEFGASI